jgi:hypothetical protein
MPRKSKTKYRRSKRNLRKTKNKSRKNIHKQKKYYMIGCNNKCHCPCHRRGGSNPIGGLSMNGGSCFGPLVGDEYSTKGGNYYPLPDKSAYTQYQQLNGGGIIPDNLQNAGRQIIHGVDTVVKGLGGYKADVSPLPYEQKI